MIEKLSHIFERYTEAVVLLRDGAEVWRNAAARALLPQKTLRLEDLCPPELAQARDGAVSEIRLAGQTFTVSLAELDGCGVVTLWKQEPAARKSDLLTGISGRAKSLMMTMRMSSDFLRPRIEELRDPKLDQYMAVLYHSHYSLMQIADNLRYLSGESGRILRDKEPLDVTTLCEKLVESANSLTLGKLAGIDLAAEESVWVRGDRTALENMLLNLLSNSLKHTPPEGRITVSVRKGDGKAYLVVSDTGEGIPPERLSSVFTRYTIPAEERGDREGPGIGLPAVMRIAREHGGTAVLESRPGEGTKVTVILPEETRGSRFKTPVAPYAERGMAPLLAGLSDVLSYESYQSRYLD